MGIKWLILLLGSLALLHNTRAEEEIEEEVPEIEAPEEAADEDIEEHSRVRRQSGCKDLLDYCAQWPDKYCQDYKDYMKTNCPKKCGYCSGPTQPPGCTDKSQHCLGWKTNGYCATGSQWYSYMQTNCAKTCNFCGGGGGGGGGGGSCTTGASTRVKSCNFDSHTCDWYQVPFDDNKNFDLESGAAANGGSGGYLSLSSGKAQLILPLELVLPHQANYGSMCLRFHYKGLKGAEIIVYEIANRRGSKKTEKRRVRPTGSTWTCERVTVRVGTGNQLMIEASGSVGLDDISFADGACA